MQTIAVLSLLFGLSLPIADAEAHAPTLGQGDTLILADPGDAYYSLAEEIAQHETLPIVHSLDQVLAQDPVFLLWVVSPTSLSDQALVKFGLAMRDRPSALSVGIISGLTLEDARQLWRRAPQARGERAVAVNAANPSGHIEAQVATVGMGQATVQPLTKANLIQSLQNADYLTFTGHGGKSYLALEKGLSLRSADIPALSPVVIATASCNTFRPWEDQSIALAFVGQGAAAYAGFAYSPNAGYLIGAYEGLPFRYTWPDFPIGHAVQVQNHGTLQGFAQFPIYYLLGDPRIALQDDAPYRLVGSRVSDNTLTLSYAGAPPGFMPVYIPDAARYSFAKIPGVGAVWEQDPFYNANLQMANIGHAKFVLFDHPGGDFSLQLGARPPWYWVVGDILTDALDDTLLYIQQSSGDIISLAAAAIVLVVIGWLLWRKRMEIRPLALAVITGLGFATLHGLYALARLDRVTITSKQVAFRPLSPVATFLLVGCGLFLFLNARSWRGRLIAVWVASFHALAPGVLGTAIIAVLNTFFFKPQLGTGLYNYALGLQPLVVLLLESILFGLVFSMLRRQKPQRGLIESA